MLLLCTSRRTIMGGRRQVQSNYTSDAKRIREDTGRTYSSDATLFSPIKAQESASHSPLSPLSPSTIHLLSLPHHSPTPSHYRNLRSTPGPSKPSQAFGSLSEISGNLRGPRATSDHHGCSSASPGIPFFWTPHRHPHPAYPIQVAGVARRCSSLFRSPGLLDPALLAADH
ncbi:hypothetical protein RvY_14231-1 [Ramazzottius varieornatus]|uniref:Uncharacterized protein n=1 Tax=Ramazzottius varieornatus TaxID=947166 RepID=A0A1D1VQM0_RAMVA|nr:hypothetical protein RvY_14231-1 [Ramazzottius varieornatus]